jgi:hypothetical protein
LMDVGAGESAVSSGRDSSVVFVSRSGFIQSVAKKLKS